MGQTWTMTTPRSVTVHLVACAALGLLFVAPLLPCSTVTAGVGGPFWTGDHWLLSARRWVGWESYTVLYALDQQGELLWERKVGLGSNRETDVTLVGRTDEGELWFSVRCVPAVDPDCGHFVRLSTDGTRSARFAFPKGMPPVWIEGRGFVTARFTPSRSESPHTNGPRFLRLFDVDDSGAESLARELELPPGVSWRVYGSPPKWTTNARGEVAIVAAGDDRTTVLFWREDGKLGALRSFPRALPRKISRDGEVALGQPNSLHLNDEGELLLSSWQIHADCSSDRSGWVLLDRDGETLVDSGEEGERAVQGNTARGPDGQIALTGFSIALFERSGQLLRRFDSTPAAWEAEEQRLAQKAAALQASDPPSDWIALLPYAEPEQAGAIGSWIRDRWADLSEEAPEALWRSMAAELCTRYPETAPADVLAKFKSAEEPAKAEWLYSLTQCFDRPPAGVMEYAQQLAADQARSWRAEAAFRAWGQSKEGVDELWQELFTAPPGRSEAGMDLVRNWPETAPRFEEILRGPDGEQRRLVRRLLLETMVVWSPDFRMPYDDADRKAFEGLMQSIEGWTEDSEDSVAAYGRLLAIGHGRRDGAEELAMIEQLWPPIEAQEQAPRVWLSVALTRSLERRPPGPEDPRRQIALDILRSIPREEQWDPNFVIGAYGTGDPDLRLALTLGEEGVLTLFESATSTTSSTPQRQRLLGSLVFDPWLLGSESWQRLLAADWLVEDSGLYPLDTLDAASRAFAVTAPELVDPVQRAFRRRFLKQGDGALRSIFALYTRGWGSPLLVRRLERSDVREVFTRSRARYGDWLWVLQDTGGWPAIRAQLEELLRRGPSDQRLRAARALSFERHQGAFDVLLELGLHYVGNAEALARYGQPARAAVLEHADHPEGSVRNTVRAVVRRLGPTAEDLERFEAEAQSAYSDGRLPLPEALLALHDAGREIAPRLVEALQAARPPDPRSSYAVSGELFGVLARAATTEAERRETKEALQNLWASESPEGRSALRLLGQP